jgi:hypothetical protein
LEDGPHSLLFIALRLLALLCDCCGHDALPSLVRSE